MSTTDIYTELGIQPVINAVGNLTLLGGSSMVPEAQAAIAASNGSFASMGEVLDKTGIAIADMVGAEEAFVTSGCFAALVLGTAAMMTGMDPDKIAQLPDTTGMKDQFLLQTKMRYRYDRSLTVAGGKMVEVGDENGTTAEQLAAAIGPQTAGILYYARGESTPGVLSLDEVSAIAKEHGVPVLLDAAAEIYPVERMRDLPGRADLVCFGAKYFGSGHSTGILCGRSELVTAARHNNFLAYEAENNRAVGRGYKVDRQEALAVTMALRAWVNMDHEERLQEESTRIEAISTAIGDLPHVTPQSVWDAAWMRLVVTVDGAGLGKSAKDVENALKAGDPPIWTRAIGDDLNIAVNTLKADEVSIVAERLRAALTT